MNKFSNESSFEAPSEVSVGTIEISPFKPKVLNSFLSSVNEYYESKGIPISDTTWNEETGEFMLEFVTPETSQAYDAICHGGFSTTVLDTMARLAILNEGLQEGQDDSKYQSSTKYMRKVSVGAKIRVIGKIDTSEGVEHKSTAYMVDVLKPTKVLTKYTLDMNVDTDPTREDLVENSSEDVDEKRLEDVSSDSKMLEHYLFASHEFYQSNGIQINEAVWSPENQEVTLELIASNLNCVNGELEDGIIATLLDTMAGLPVFLESSQKGKIALSDELSIVSLEKIKEGSVLKIIGKINSLDEQKSKSSAVIFDITNPTQILAKGSLTMNIRESSGV